jgi:hypothetical protein
MKPTITTSAAAATPVSVPTFDATKAKRVEPTRHEPTGRTFCFVQEGYLFSATGVPVAPAPSVS